RCFHCILNMLILKEFYSAYVQLSVNKVPPETLNNTKLYSFFLECHSTLDGS
ncbi:hypothetical protein BYT27DRAFT_7065500, partial [Phlegmacium glaucopus]